VVIVLLVLILVGTAMGYLVFVVFCAAPRRKQAQRANVMNGPPPADLALSVHPATLGWTALDDRQLTRLLKGSEP
jgi:hypothetical protein